MNLFQPVGDRARWRNLYDVLHPLRPGDVATYKALAEAVGLNPDEDRRLIQMTIRRAAREFAAVDQHALEVIPNIGYRVVAAPEHLRLARGQQKRANRALARGRSHVEHVDLNDLEPETRRAFLIVAQAFALQQDMLRRLDVRQKRLEDVVESVNGRTERTENELQEMRDRLARLEQRATGAAERNPAV